MTTTSTTRSLGLAGQLVDALSTRRFDVLRACFDDDVRLRALVPPGPFELNGADQVAERFRTWFGDREEYSLVDASLGDVGSRTYARWRIRVAGPLLVEQHVFLACGEKVEQIDLLCSGFVAE